jgi:hypothetical protein
MMHIKQYKMINNRLVSDNFMQFLCIIYAFYARFMHEFYAQFMWSQYDKITHFFEPESGWDFIDLTQTDIPDSGIPGHIYPLKKEITTQQKEVLQPKVYSHTINKQAQFNKLY